MKNLILLAIAGTIGGLLLLVSMSNNVYGITVNNTDFSVNVLHNWAYRQPTDNPLTGALAKVFGVNPPLILIPTEFSNFLVNTSSNLTEAIHNGGGFSQMTLDTDYPYRNVPLEVYTQYNINKSPVKIFSKENTTIDGEPAVKIHRTPRTNFSNVDVVEYYVVHDSKPYTLQYAANVKDFQKYLPQFEQMVKTFKFVK